MAVCQVFGSARPSLSPAALPDLLRLLGP